LIFALGAALLAAVPLVPVGEGWTPALRDQLEQGLAALPEGLREFPGGPLELELHSMPAPFGMGNAELPEWTQGHRRFHLYGFAPDGERRASWRLEELTADERTRLWRQRAVVHAVMQRWEDVHHFSRRRAWKSLNGWLGALERPFTWSERALNLADAAYSRKRGQQSAELDWLTFAEEHFVPVEALHPGAIAADDTVACQEFSKARVLEELLAEQKLLVPRPEVSCPAFDAWADLAHLEQLEVLLVQASGRRAQSLFGHVLLRPVHREGALVRGPTFDTAIQLAALTDPEAGMRHIATGIFGGYRMTVFTISWRDFEREMLEDEQRSMRRFRLELSTAQARRVLERSWELERRGEFDYQFFSDNCAAGLQWLLQGALGEQLVVVNPGGLIIAPGAVVDGLALSTLEGRPLLVRLADDLESTAERAERSEAQRAVLERRVLAQLPADEASVWARRFEQTRVYSPSARIAAYTWLQEATGAHRLRMLYDWWALSVRVERLSADAADQVLRSLNRRTILPGAGAPYDPSAELLARQKSFEKESELQRHWMILDRAEQVQAALAALPHRPLSESEREEDEAARASLAAFDQLTALHGALVASVFSDFDGNAWLEADRAQKTGERAVIDGSSLAQSGHWRTLVGAGAWVDAAGAVRPVIALQSSGIGELLGDQRVRGFQRSSELRMLDTELIFAPQLGWPQVVQSRFTLFGFRSIKRELPMIDDGPLARFGWGVDLNTDYRLGRTLPARTSLSGELLAVAGHDSRYASFVTGGLGVVGFVGWGDGAFAPGLGPYAVATGRVPLSGNGVDAARLEAQLSLGVAPTLSQKLLPEVRGTASIDWMIGQPGGHALLLKPQVWAQLQPGSKPVQAVAVVALELL
jgi:hypothetical protein